MKSLKSAILIRLSFLGILFTTAQDSTCNCCSENHKDFDFWVGSWEVTNPDGSIAGTNTIVKSLDNCILQGNWISVKAGYGGTSTNFYNKETNQWEQ